MPYTNSKSPALFYKQLLFYLLRGRLYATIQNKFEGLLQYFLFIERVPILIISYGAVNLRRRIFLCFLGTNILDQQRLSVIIIGDSVRMLMVHKRRGLEEIFIKPDYWVLKSDEDEALRR